MKKGVFVLIIVILAILIGYSVSISNKKATPDEQIKIAIYPSSGGLSETYYFALTTDGQMLVKKGTRAGDDITKTSFIIENGVYDYKYEKKQIASSKVSKIMGLINKVYEGSYDTSAEEILDSWCVQILYKEKIIKQDYWQNISPQVKTLIDEFIKMSPIEVDLHGWS